MISMKQYLEMKVLSKSIVQHCCSIYEAMFVSALCYRILQVSEDIIEVCDPEDKLGKLMKN